MEMVKVHCCCITGGFGGTALIATQLTQTQLTVYWPLAIVYCVPGPQMEQSGRFIPLKYCKALDYILYAIHFVVYDGVL